MNKLLILGCLIVFSACKKNNDNSADAYIKFKANNVQYEWRGTSNVSDFNNQLPSVNTAGVLLVWYNYNGWTKNYMLFGHDFTNNRNQTFSLNIFPDSILTPSSYRYASGGPSAPFNICRFVNSTQGDMLLWKPGKQFVNESSEDSIFITVSSVHDMQANGTFRGQLTDLGDLSQKMQISEGEFNNVPIVGYNLVR